MILKFAVLVWKMRFVAICYRAIPTKVYQSNRASLSSIVIVAISLEYFIGSLDTS